ncbi:MAG: GTP-binding protein [Methanomassiliicoccales archaeon]|nr:MAG: GTP-binding protein [Methanomassiliicoccales archaeon]
MATKNTFIPRLDSLLNGGLPQGKSLAFSADPGVPSDIFGYQVLGERLKNNGEKGFIYTNTQLPNYIERQSYGYGWNIKEYVDSKRLFFIDSASIRLGLPGAGKYNIYNDSEIPNVISKAIEEIHGGIGVIADVAMLLETQGYEDTWEMMRTWNQSAKENEVNLIYIFTKWDYEDNIIKTFNSLVDCEVRIQPMAERVIFKQVFSVVKSNWTDHSNLKIFFETLKPGGVAVFIPKLLVTGPYNAGKTSFVKAVTTESVSVDRQAYERFPTTVGLDIGHLEHRGFSADVFGTPGQERFDLLLEVLAREAMGTFIIIDSTKPETFLRAQKMITLCKVEAIPKVIVANKQDLDDALSPAEIRLKMNLSERIPIIPTSVANNEGVTEALDTLLNMIYR